MTTAGQPDRPASLDATAARFSVLVVAALGVLAGVLSTLAVSPPPSARAEATPPAARGMLAVAGQLTTGTYGLYLVDADGGNLAVYEYVGGERRLHLRAARSFLYDLRLEQYNTEPKVSEVADMVRQALKVPDVSGDAAPSAGPQE